jgi:hypothetical protein
VTGAAADGKKIKSKELDIWKQGIGFMPCPLLLWQGCSFLHPALQLEEKLMRRGQENAVLPSQLLHLRDDDSHMRFLVGTSSACSVFPHQFYEKPSGGGLTEPRQAAHCQLGRETSLCFFQWQAYPHDIPFG